MMAVEGGAIFSVDGMYRYRLWRRWSRLQVPLAVIGLNPSTADASHDDPTVRKWRGFATRLGYGGVDVCNAFAFRSTDPKATRKAAEPVGPENDWHIRQWFTGRDVLCCWGAQRWMEQRQEQVIELLKAAGCALYCLGTTEDGWPRHPLMLPYSTSMMEFRAVG